jgi:cell wall-associated NlpC family hydrolase
MGRAQKIRTATAAAVATVALSLPIAVASAEPATTTTAIPGATIGEPKEAVTAGPLEQGATLAPPSEDESKSEEPGANGGLNAGDGTPEPNPDQGEEEAVEESGGTTPTDPGAAITLPAFPTSSCASSGVPPVLIPIYQRASNAYGLGPQGPAVLAGINEIETGFGQNLGPSYAGAVGWMQFMPATWDAYGVDANQDGVADPDNPEDAIFAAASYLSASGMPADVYGAIFAYNHADWYVADVLANAACFAQEVGGPGITASSLTPKIQVFKCTPAKGWRKEIPALYLRAFEGAAARYELGKRGVWTLAAVARLESDFGRGMSKEQLRETGPLGLDDSEWKRYAVDGDEDGRISREDPVDSAATLARMIWSRGSIEAGVFSHNQAEWYVQEVLSQADAMTGECKVRYADWALAPLDSGFVTPGAQAVLMGKLASAPRGAPEAVKAVIAAANSITHTPYVWGGGHGSWYSYGYDCSGSVSYALHGAGLLDTPLVSGALAGYGEPGPGKWITIYANATHVYMEVAGLRFDTVGNFGGETGPRWHNEPPYPEGFEVRHPTGY